MKPKTKHCYACDQNLPTNAFYDYAVKQTTGVMCKKCQKDYEKKDIGKRYKNYKRHAKTAHKAFTLTKEQFKRICAQPCYYCGSFNDEDLDDTPFNGIDRVDNNKGYVKDNCVPCCSECNFMKAKLDQYDFLEQVKQIYEYQERKTK